jgi:hypothetical protein
MANRFFVSTSGTDVRVSFNHTHRVPRWLFPMGSETSSVFKNGGMQVHIASKHLLLWYTFLVVVLATLCLGILQAIILQGSVVSALVTIAAAPWGAVTLVDLGTGLVVASVWIGWRDGGKHAWPWWIGLACLGNVALLVYLLWRTHSSHSIAHLLLGRHHG